MGLVGIIAREYRKKRLIIFVDATTKKESQSNDNERGGRLMQCKLATESVQVEDFGSVRLNTVKSLIHCKKKFFNQTTIVSGFLDLSV